MDVHRRGGGAPLEGRGLALGRALGAQGARVHTDERAAAAARAAGANALAYGEHVGFAAGRYRPGTATGDLLLAHELAHVVQQRDEEMGTPGRAGADLEADADQAAAAAFLDQPARPALRSRLTLGLDSCFSSGPSAHTRADRWMDLLRDPETNRQQMLDMLADDDNVDAIASIRGAAYTDSGVRTIARSSAAAREVMGRLADRLHDRGHTSQETTVRGVLTQLGQTTPDPAAASPELADLRALRRAVAADTRHAAHFASIGLDVSTIEIYDVRRAIAGRVYYDPALDRDSTSTVVTGGQTAIAVSGPTAEAFYPGAIQIGPHGVRGHSDESIRSTVFHEALHRTLHLEAKRGATATDARTRDLRTEMFAGRAGSTVGVNEETEVTSRQIETDLLPVLAVRDDHNRPRNDEAAAMFSYLAMFYPRANTDFRRAAVQRIVRALTGHQPELRRTLVILRGLSESERRALADVEQALAALVPPAPPHRDRGGGRGGGGGPH